ncbi:Actin-related protein 6 [Dissostichus eleginoides]|uniref:Actin-related protein 6 n=1 Tax=Dissostichus eleginoides TaxID=100907 RepID=A0AAD9F3Z3_DISEL|nr:Actin-related protein 6 [Dissostichus eleginoides]
MATLVLDNGAYSAKIGFSQEKVRLKTFTANQLDEIKDPSGLFYILPFQKGYLVNWDVQRKVWDHLFGKEMFKVDFADTSVIITEPYFNFSSIQESMNEILFEEYQFQSVLRTNAGSLSAHHFFSSRPSELCCLLVDGGFSFTHIIPYCRSKKMKEGIRRVNVGGKLLTNHLKEIISYRQLHVMDETHVINQVKEDVCYVSQQFFKDMEISQMKGEENTVVRDYVLPDFSSIKKASARHRHPGDGIPEAIVHSIQSLPEEMHAHFFQNIVLTGGNILFPGFRERLEAELRALAPAHLPVSVLQPDNPICYPWEGGKLLAHSPDYEEIVVTREDFEENGHFICEEKFDI